METSEASEIPETHETTKKSTLNKNTALVLQGFLKLSKIEQEEFIKNLHDYQQRSLYSYSTIELDETIRKSINVTFGPLNEACPCCGK